MAKTRSYLVICFYFPLPDYHSNRTHLYYKTVKLTKFSSAVNRADSYMKLKFFIKTIFRHNQDCFTEVLIKTRSKLTLNFKHFYWILVFSRFDR